MAIQPSVRMAGSSHHLRFAGTLLEQNSDVQTNNAEVVNTAAADVATIVTFALADMTDLDDETTKLPSWVYDDALPAGAAPHSNTQAGQGPGTSAPAGKTWAQNVKVRVQEFTASTATPLIARVDELLPFVEIDGAAGFGLGQGTGVPCVLIAFHFTAAGIAALQEGQQPGIAVIVEIEVPHTIGR